MSTLCTRCTEHEKIISELRVAAEETRQSHFKEIVDIKKFRPMKVFLRLLMSFFFVVWMIVSIAGVIGPMLGIAFRHFSNDWWCLSVISVVSCIVWFFTVIDVTSRD